MSRWNEAVAAIASWRLTHGTVDPPAGSIIETEYGTFPIGDWVTLQRADFLTTRLDSAAVQLFDSLGVDWVSRDPVETYQWRLGVAWLTRWRAHHPNEFRPANSYVTETRYRLGDWVTRVHGARARGELEPGDVGVLDALGVWHGRRATGFERGLHALREFVSEHGVGEIPTTYRATNGVILAQWVSRQRRRFRAGTLSESNVAAVEALGVALTSPRERQFRDALTLLRAYVREHSGQMPSPSARTDGGFQIGQWLRRLREQHDAGRLSVVRVELLDALVQEENCQPWNAPLSASNDADGAARKTCDRTRPPQLR